MPIRPGPCRRTTPIRLPRQAEPLSLAWQPIPNGLTATLPAPLPADGELLVVASLRDGAPHLPGPFPRPARGTRRRPQRTGDRARAARRLVRITVEGQQPLAQVLSRQPVERAPLRVLRRFAPPPLERSSPSNRNSTRPAASRAEAWFIR